ncbi:hypothetical protein BVRB_2g024940 [Beta vulgaris subsp. vulgaris]|nr:hypothetical protein BVRB_2g024940 [Beta vulgaris subsp. vulgaris]
MIILHFYTLSLSSKYFVHPSSFSLSLSPLFFVCVCVFMYVYVYMYVGDSNPRPPCDYL